VLHPFNLYESDVVIGEWTPWVPAAEFNEHIGIDGVNIESGYGSVSIYNSLHRQYGWIDGTLEVYQWDAFTDKRAAYPVLHWCRSPEYALATE
jgi:hypothetical protein